MSAMAEKYLLIAGLTTIVVTALLRFAMLARGKEPWWPMATGLIVTLLFLFAALTTRWLRESQGPFLTLYDVLLSNLFSLSLVFLVAASLVPALRASTMIVLVFLASLGAWSLIVAADAVPLPATFDNPWLWLHVVSGKLFLGLCMLAAATASLMLSRSRSSRTGAGVVLSEQGLDEAVWLTMSLAFVCHSFMLIAGAIWAHSAWGRYWAWDSLETWAFITWLAIALLLHARVTFTRMPAALGWSVVVVIFAVAVLTFFGVPFISVAPHKGMM